MKCSVCDGLTKDVLVYGYKKKKIFFWEFELGKTTKSFCRQHLIEEFKKYFLGYKGKMIVFYPELEKKRGSYVFGCMSMKEVVDRKMTEYATLGSKSLERIAGQCRECADAAQVAYFEEGVLLWRGGKGYPVDLDFPVLKNINSEPFNLCNKCALRKIEFSLKSFADNYSEGLFIPFVENSMMMTFPI